MTTFTPLDANTGIVASPTWDVLPDGERIRLRFARTFAAGGDSTDLALDVDSPTWILVSHGNEGVYTPGYHGPSNRRAYKLVLADCTGGASLEDAEDDKHFTRMIHGLTMFFGWGLASAAGVFVARYCRHRRWWIELHVKAMSAASVGAISALILAVGIVQTQLAHWHAILGASVMALTLVQVGMGWFVHSRRMLRLGAEGGSSAAEAWVAFAHRMTGRTLFAGAMVNMFEGLRLIGATSYFAVSLGVFLSLVGSAFVVAEVHLQITRRRPEAQRKQQKELVLGTALATVQAAVRARMPASTALKHAASMGGARTRRVSPETASRLIPASAGSSFGDGTSAPTLIAVEESGSDDSGASDNERPARTRRPGAAMRAAARSVVLRRRGTMALISAERERHAVVDTAQYVEDAASLAPGLADQIHAQVVFTTILDARHCAILASAPAGRAAAQVQEAAVALAALPMFAGSRVAVAALHAAGVRKQATVSRIAQANEALRMAGRLDRGEERLVESWWSAHPRLLDLCATAVLVLDADAGPLPDAGRGGGVAGVRFGPDPGPREDDGAAADGSAASARATAGVLDDVAVPAARGRIAMCISHRLGPSSLLPSKSGIRVVAPFVVVRGSVSIGLLRATSGLIPASNPAFTGDASGREVTAAETAAEVRPREDVVSRVTVEAGQRWSPQLAHPHVVLGCASDTLVLVFEPLAWARFNDADAALIPLAHRLTPSADGAKAAAPSERSCAVM